MTMLAVDKFAHECLPQNSPLMLHLGCGGKYWKGWCNIDAYPSCESDTHRGDLDIDPDVWCNITNIPCSPSSVDVIVTHHVLEHFYAYEVQILLTHFYSLLKPGGLLITEMPDLSRILFILKYFPSLPKYSHNLNGRNVVLSQLYGASWESNSSGYPYHKYVWSRDEYCSALQTNGFEVLLSTGSTLSHLPFRDMAVIACKNSLTGSTNDNPLADKFIRQYGNYFIRCFRQLRSIVSLLRNKVF
ncbi:methyltransferase domain-containing protein [bacterium]|nr:methyltransferase domain-containing protein [bacterium]